MIFALLIFNIAFLAIFGTHAQQESRATTEEGNESAAQQARERERERESARGREQGWSGGRVYCELPVSGCVHSLIGKLTKAMVS
jgi:hypothetical protein